MTKNNGSVLTPPSGKFAGGTLVEESLVLTTKAIVFGDSGSGKTTLLATAPRPLYVVNLDNSINSLPREKDIFIYPNPNQRRPVESWDEFEELLDWLEAGAAESFATIAFDTGTELGVLKAKKILSEPGPTGRFHPKVLSKADYNTFAVEMAEALRRIRDLPCNVVVNCQIQDHQVEDANGTSEMFRFASFGYGQKTAQEAPAMFDMVGYLGVTQDEDGELVRKLLVQPINNRRSKIRTAPGVQAPTVVDNPNLADLFKLVTGG